MCGIAGFVGADDMGADTVAAMAHALRKRGPDAGHEVFWNADGAPMDSAHGARHGLIHRRLSIRDPEPRSDQPMASADGRVWLCYNGEVYGWEDDARELERRGYRFKTRSDTEFILHAWCEWGEAMLPRLRGMFAIAILDLRQRALVLVRDRMGIKPLVYAYDGAYDGAYKGAYEGAYEGAHHGARNGGRLVFGSTVRSVLPALTKEQRRLNPAAIDAYLAHRYVPAPATVFAGVRRLPRAHLARFGLDDGALSLRRYWTPEPDSVADPAEVLRAAVDLRTVADRPLGLFLSSGVDSTVVAGLLAQTGHEQLAAFTAAFPGTAFDEAPQARATAERLNLRHRPIDVVPDVGADLDALVEDLDEPFADPSAIPLWYLARGTVREATVVLGGDGGDELFGGYKRYAKHLRNAWRGGLRLPRSGRYRGDELPGKGAKLRDELGMSWQEAYALRFSGMGPSLRSWLQGGAAVQANAWAWPEGNGDGGGDRGRDLERLLAIDLDNYLPEYILRKADLCTMAHGLELRVPLLDHRFYEAVLAMPRARRFTDPAKQWLASQVPGGESLPGAPKRGFNPPMDDWLRGPLAPRLEGLGTSLEQATGGQIAAARTDRFVAAWRSGERAAKAEQVLQLLLLDLSLGQLHQGHGR